MRPWPLWTVRPHPRGLPVSSFTIQPCCPSPSPCALCSAGAVRASSIFPILSVILLFMGGLCIAASEFYKTRHNIILSAGIFFVSAGKARVCSERMGVVSPEKLEAVPGVEVEARIQCIDPCSHVRCPHLPPTSQERAGTNFRAPGPSSLLAPSALPEQAN